MSIVIPWKIEPASISKQTVRLVIDFCIVRKLFLQCFFHFWNVNVNIFHYSFQDVIRSRLERSWPLAWAFSTLLCPEKLRNGKERSGMVNGQGRWTVLKFKKKSRSRFRNERNTVLILCVYFILRVYSLNMRIVNKIRK